MLSKILTRPMQFFIALLGLTLLNPACAELKTGNIAPDFTLPDQTGQATTLSAYRGNWVVLYFYPKNDTPGCTAEACSFRDNINRLIQQNATILGVSIDNVASHEAFTQKYKLPFKLLADPEGSVAAKYDSVLNLGIVRFAKRHSFIIDPQGRLAKIYRNVDPDKHVAEVLQDLKTLQTRDADTP